MASSTAVCVLDAKAVVGEGPVWSEAEQALWWVDIVACTLHRFEWPNGTLDTWAMPCRIGSVGLRGGGGLVLALETGFALFDPGTGELVDLAGFSPASTGARFNDGVVSPEGHFLATTMKAAPPFDDPTQTVQVLHPDRSTTELISGLRVGNGLEFSPDGRTLYVSETHQKHAAIWAFDWRGDECVATNQRLFFDPSQISGKPDGAAVDSEGFYWFASVGGWQIVRLSPDGRIDTVIPVPIEKPSKVAFGGPNLDTLFVTSIARDLEIGSSRRQPFAGGLFAIKTDARGLNARLFGG